MQADLKIRFGLGISLVDVPPYFSTFIGSSMDKHKILMAAKAELSQHVWDYYCTESKSVAGGGNGVIVP
jgi:hypothetical protein